jgi:hypothetical protein
MSSDLAACPFCGNEDIKEVKQFGYYFVLCNNCYAQGPQIRKFRCLELEEPAARLAWNIRK